MLKKIILFLSVVMIGVICLNSSVLAEEEKTFLEKLNEQLSRQTSGADGTTVVLQQTQRDLSNISAGTGCGKATASCPTGVNCSCSGATPTPCPEGTFYKTMSEYIQENQNACWFCDIFYTDTSAGAFGGGLFGAVNQLATNIYNTTAKWFGAFMGMGILFFILFKVGKMLVSLQEVDLMQFLNDLLKPLGRGIIAAALLGLTMSNVSFEVFHGLTNPIFMAAAEMGNKIMDASLGSVQFLEPGGDMNNLTGTNSTTGETYRYNWQFTTRTCGTQAAALMGSTDETASVLSQAQGKVLRCWMEQVSSSFITGIAIGGTLIRVSMEEIYHDGFPMFLVGLILWGGFWLLYLMFPFRVLDAFIKFAFVMTLMPLWIVLWVFPATRGYTKKAWEMFLSACLLLMVLALMISLTLMLVENSIPSSAKDGLLTCLRAGLDKAALSWISFGSGAILNALAFTAMGWALLKESTTISNSFIGGGGSITTNVGNSVAGTMAQAGALGWAATKTGAKVGRWGYGKATEGLDKGLNWAATPAAGARASKINRFFEGVRHPSTLFANRGELYDKTTLGTDMGRLTSRATGKVDSAVMSDVAKIQRLATTGIAGDQVALQDMKNKAKTETERGIMENIMRSAEHKMPIDPNDIKALKDERARQEMMAHPLSERAQEGQLHMDETTKRGQIASQRADFARVKARFERQTNADLSKYETAALLTNETTYAAQRDSMCSTLEQKQAMDQLHLAAKNNGGVIDSGARDTFIDNMSTAKAMESLPDAAAYVRTDKAAISWAANPNSVTATETLQNDMAYVEHAMANASNQTQFREMIAQADFSAANKHQMETFSDQLWDARGRGEGQVNRTIQSFISTYMQRNGESKDNADLLAEQVALTSKAGVMAGEKLAISSSVGALRK